MPMVRILSRNCSTMRLSCFSSLFVNSAAISRNAKLGGGPVGSFGFSSGVVAKRTASRWRAVIASRFLSASRPNERAKRFDSSWNE